FLCATCHGLAHASQRRYVSPRERLWRRFAQLEQQLRSTPVESERWERAAEQQDRVAASLSPAELLVGPLPRSLRGTFSDILAGRTPLDFEFPKRGRGRPSKRAIRGRERLVREAVKQERQAKRGKRRERAR